MTKATKKLLALLCACTMIFIMGAGLLTGCSVTDGAPGTGEAFAEKIAARDYAGAYEYIYSLSSDVQSQEDFVTRFENIYEVLEITDVSLLNYNVAQKTENEYSLTYSLQLQSSLLGTLHYDYTTDIVAGPLGYNVIYTPSLILPMLEEGDKVRVLNQQGARGEIFSADGQLLAKNGYAQSIYVDLEQTPDIAVIKNFLTAEYGAEAEQIQKKYDNAVEKGFPTEVLLTFPAGTLSEAQKTAVTEINGLGVDESRLTAAREYPLRDTASHLLGYLGSPSEEQLNEEAGITASTLIGQTGLEKAMDDTLRGTGGRIIYIEDSKGDRKEILYEDAKTDGADIHLTIDAELQERAYTLLASNMREGESGCVVVLDYKTGAVESMVSYPSFDNNLFGFTTMQDILSYYASEDANNGNPLLNRAIQATYPPGSSIKPFTAVPAIEAGLMTESSEPPVTTEYNAERNVDTWLPEITGWVYPEITTLHSDAGGPLVFENAMRSSNNIYFAYYALQYVQQYGEDAFYNYLASIGLDGESPQFELPVRAANLINEDTERNLHLVATTAHGVGNILCTPLQFACMYTAFENSGDMLNPYIVERVTRTTDTGEEILSQTQPSLFKSNTMSDSTIALEKIGMYKVFHEGTAYGANLRNSVYGKTGTAPITVDGAKREINWVVAVNPNADDTRLYLVMTETDVDIGSDPKLAILHGLVNPDGYNNALKMAPYDTGSGDEDDAADDTQHSEPDTSNDPEPSDDPEPSGDPAPSNDPEPDNGNTGDDPSGSADGGAE